MTKSYMWNDYKENKKKRQKALIKGGKIKSVTDKRLAKHC